jgi:hypothetical protein
LLVDVAGSASAIPTNEEKFLESPAKVTEKNL